MIKTILKILLNLFSESENTIIKKYADLGYRTISIDKFIDHAGYGTSIDELINVKRQENENLFLHAELYEQVKPSVQFDTYDLPSTETEE